MVLRNDRGQTIQNLPINVRIINDFIQNDYQSIRSDSEQILDEFEDQDIDEIEDVNDEINHMDMEEEEDDDDDDDDDEDDNQDEDSQNSEQIENMEFDDEINEMDIVIRDNEPINDIHIEMIENDNEIDHLDFEDGEEGNQNSESISSDFFDDQSDVDEHIDNFEEEEFHEDYENSSWETLTISHEAPLSNASERFKDIQEDFFANKLFEKYPFTFPLNLIKKDYIFYNDQFNLDYQQMIINSLLKQIKMKTPSENVYNKCNLEFQYFDYKRWERKYQIDGKKNQELIWHTRILRTNNHRIRINEQMPLFQYFDIIRPNNNSQYQRRLNQINQISEQQLLVNNNTTFDLCNALTTLIEKKDEPVNKMEEEEIEKSKNIQEKQNEQEQNKKNEIQLNQEEIVQNQENLNQQSDVMEIQNEEQQQENVQEQQLPQQNQIQEQNQNQLDLQETNLQQTQQETQNQQIIQEEEQQNQLNELVNQPNQVEQVIEQQNNDLHMSTEDIENEQVDQSSQNNEEEDEENNQQSENEEEQEEVPQNNAQQQESINFQELGLPENFLEIAQIDPTFFFALPLDLQTELALQHGEALNIRTQPIPRQEPQQPQPQPLPQPQENQEQNVQVEQNNNLNESENNISETQRQLIQTANNNLIFIQSLDPHLREEVLLTSPNEFLLSLPQDIQEEARRLRATQLINNTYQHQQNALRARQVNTIEQKLKKSLEGNKQSEMLKKIYPVKIYPVNENILQIFKTIEDKRFNLKYVPLSLISCLMMDENIQNNFFKNFFNILDKDDSIISQRYLTVTEKLTYSNFMFFQEKKNFDQLLGYLLKYDKNSGHIKRLLNIILHVIRNSVQILKNNFECNIKIDKKNLECLTHANFVKTESTPISEYISRILIILSFNKDNLFTIIQNLKTNISSFAFNLNLHLDSILNLSQNDKNWTIILKKKINKNLDFYNRFFKLFKLVEQLFAKTFKSILQEENISDKDKQKKENDKFEKIKEKVLNEFQCYFDDEIIKNVFSKLFRVVYIFELQIDSLLKKKTFSKPLFYNFLPLLESFFIIYRILCDDEAYQSIKKNLNFITIRKAQISKYIDKIQSEEESDREFIIKSEDLNIETLFYKVCQKNKKILNYFMKKMPKLSDSSMRVIIKKAPKIVDFDLKRIYFKQKTQFLKINGTLRLKIRREHLFTDSFTQIIGKKSLDFRQKLHISFTNEEGEDAGGLTREWFEQLSKEIFNPNYALFIPAAHGYAFQPSPYSGINQEHLRYFKFIGIIIAKALLDGQLLDAHFTQSFYKHMVQSPLNYLDFQDYDPEYFKNLKWMLENDVEPLDLNFSYETNTFGVIHSKPLKDNGINIPVTNDNKQEYIRLLCYAKMANEIKPQIESFLEGLHEVVPPDLIKIFNPKELELMISGLPEIDISDLRKNTVYVNYTKDSPTIQNFWKAMNNFDENLKAGFLQFVTGTSKVPLDGFAHLKGMGNDIQKFQIHKAYDNTKLPTSHTCMNQMDLPEYETLKDLESKLKIAILYGKEGFGFL